MATVIITITDADDDGNVSAELNFVGGFDANSEAHTLAADMAMDLKQGATDD